MKLTKLRAAPGERVTDSSASILIDLDAIQDASPDAPAVIKLANVLLVDSVKRGASQLHIRPRRDVSAVLYRIHGVLRLAVQLPLKLHQPLVGRIKASAHFASVGGRVRQGSQTRIRATVAGRARKLAFNVRCTTTRHGETIVLEQLPWE